MDNRRTIRENRDQIGIWWFWLLVLLGDIWIACFRQPQNDLEALS